MLKEILEIKGITKLDKKEQLSLVGGMCPTYPASECIACGGSPRPNGCCLGNYFTFQCLG